MDSSALDLDGALERVSGDLEFLEELISIYYSSSKESITAIDLSINQNDSKALAKAAHAFCSASSNIGANAIAKLCREIELKAQAGDTSNAPELAKKIGLLIEDFKKLSTNWLKNRSTGQ